MTDQYGNDLTKTDSFGTVRETKVQCLCGKGRYSYIDPSCPIHGVNPARGPLATTVTQETPQQEVDRLSEQLAANHAKLTSATKAVAAASPARAVLESLK